MDQDLNPQKVKDELSAKRAILIDVREPHEFAAERIHGALNMPLSTFDPDGLPKLAGQTLIFQCGSGKRSRTALDRFAAARGESAAHLSGGIGAWKQAALPVVRIDPATGQVIDPGRF